jgi:hypothetical protein
MSPAAAGTPAFALIDLNVRKIPTARMTMTTTATTSTIPSATAKPMAMFLNLAAFLPSVSEHDASSSSSEKKKKEEEE